MAKTLVAIRAYNEEVARGNVIFRPGIMERRPHRERRV